MYKSPRMLTHLEYTIEHKFSIWNLCFNALTFTAEPQMKCDISSYSIIPFQVFIVLTNSPQWKQFSFIPLLSLILINFRWLCISKIAQWPQNTTEPAEGL